MVISVPRFDALDMPMIHPNILHFLRFISLFARGKHVDTVKEKELNLLNKYKYDKDLVTFNFNRVQGVVNLPKWTYEAEKVTQAHN